MLLTLDIGNTNIVAGVFDGAALRAHWRLATQRERTADELAAFLHFSLGSKGFSFADLQSVVIASVVPSLTPQAVEMVDEYLSCKALVLNADTNTGLINDYDEPRQ